MANFQNNFTRQSGMPGMSNEHRSAMPNHPMYQNRNFNNKIRFEPVNGGHSEKKPKNDIPEQAHFKNNETKKEEPHFPKNNSEKQGIGNIFSGILGNLFPNSEMKIDNDVVIIIFLLILLSREGADIKLLLALGYLLI